MTKQVRWWWWWRLVQDDQRHLHVVDTRRQLRQPERVCHVRVSFVTTTADHPGLCFHSLALSFCFLTVYVPSCAHVRIPILRHPAQLRTKTSDIHAEPAHTNDMNNRHITHTCSHVRSLLLEPGHHLWCNRPQRSHKQCVLSVLLPRVLRPSWHLRLGGKRCVVP